MIRTNKILSIVAGLALMLVAAPTPVWAESSVGDADPSLYFTGSTSTAYDPQAGGTKYAATLATVYDSSAPGADCFSFNVSNMRMVLSVRKGSASQAFFNTTVGPICFDFQESLVQLMLDMITNQVIPVLYPGCFPGSCPNFKVKTFTNFEYTTGSNSAEFTIAVQ